MANAGQRESSFMFSLNELARMEEERVAGEAAAERARRDAVLHEQREAEARARAEREAETRAALEAHERTARREREEAASLEAGKLAAVEEARARVAEGARAAEVDRRRTHEIELARVAGAANLRRLRRWVTAISLSFGVTVTGMATTYLAALAPRADARERHRLEERGQLDDAVRELSSKVTAGEEREQALTRDLADERARSDALTREIERMKAERSTRGHGRAPSVVATTSTAPPAPPSKGCANPLDPMCGELH